MGLLLFINFLGVCLGLVACSILFFANKTQRHANNFLILSLAALSMSMLQAILFSTGYIMKFPHFFRAFSPFYYLMMPSAYLYMRAIIFDETKLRKWDFLHFTPAILHFFEMTPWYFMDAESKRELISRFLNNQDFMIELKEGLLPPYVHNILRPILAIGYLFAMHRLLRKATDIKEGSFRIIHSFTFRWLQILFSLLIFLTIFFFATVILPAPVIGRTNMIHIIVSSILIVINFYLFSKPQILYGIPHISQLPDKSAGTLTIEETTSLLPDVDNESQPVSEEITASTAGTTHSALDYLVAYQPLVEKHLSTTRPYLRPGYSLIQLSEETGIPRHHLSALLNKIYGARFNDFINRYRIQYITENMHDPEWPKLTLEGIAREAGFNSRTAFFNAIKKFTGLSPTEFLEKAKNTQINFLEKNFMADLSRQ
jgi:AraC-like DNA-binding protein